MRATILIWILVLTAAAFVGIASFRLVLHQSQLEETQKKWDRSQQALITGRAPQVVVPPSEKALERAVRERAELEKLRQEMIAVGGQVKTLQEKEAEIVKRGEQVKALIQESAQLRSQIQQASQP